MRIAIIKTTGLISIALSVLLLSAIVYMINAQDFTIVFGQSFKMILYGVLLALSGIGLFRINRVLFYSVFYLYPFLILDLLSKIYTTLTMNKVGTDAAAIDAAIERSIINTSLFLIVVVSIFLILIYKKNLEILKIKDIKPLFVHSFFSVVLFSIFFVLTK